MRTNDTFIPQAVGGEPCRLPPDRYVDSMPCDPDLIVDLGRVVWAAARLHAGVRDAINRHKGEPSDEPFEATLGKAVRELEELSESAGRDDQVRWADEIGRPAAKMRDAVVHGVTFTAEDGKQAIRATGSHIAAGRPARYSTADLRETVRHLIGASMSLPE
ncbi:hypothetical protein PACID_15300 [Acidipropionibacterium acidipropionici ATCC 4875]|uniref:Uncharacterized protein n=1 Tax=Acidipropionibacterium acidipropionici (strain ATCC 4875 / DSM 20272 / JCM 6432 / NBRC 12425 / NCIMB 8070 / 4) TaxID=1171373 RepID=K7RWM3_ACIA4|nr:hypothetical protein [Acidipropionibacterium acidipropionici]AFV89343.1 hypothetical protein PACID_15300 [Acidipropionibacterium acidipropionici ATCC 4875]